MTSVAVSLSIDSIGCTRETHAATRCIPRARRIIFGPVERDRIAFGVPCIFFFKQKTAYEMPKRLEFRRVLFRSLDLAGPPGRGLPVPGPRPRRAVHCIV